MPRLFKYSGPITIGDTLYERCEIEESLDWVETTQYPGKSKVRGFLPGVSSWSGSASSPFINKGTYGPGHVGASLDDGTAIEISVRSTTTSSEDGVEMYFVGIGEAP